MPQAFPSVSFLGPKTWQDWVGTLNRQPLFSWGMWGLSGLNGPFFFWFSPSPPVKNLSHEGNQEQGSGEGQGSFPEPGWAMPLTSPSPIPGGPGGEGTGQAGALDFLPIQPGWPWFHAFCSLHILGHLSGLASLISREANVTQSSSF